MAHGGDAVCGESIVWIWCGMTDRRRQNRLCFEASGHAGSACPCRGGGTFWESGACDGDGGSGDQAVVEGE